jgi:moderate conductance mechanosensitive channel
LQGVGFPGRFPLGHTELMLFAFFSGRYDRLVWGAVAILIAIVLSRVLRLVVVRLEARHPDEERELARLQRVETALALIATAIPYIAAIVVLIIAATAFLPRTVAALGGSALILVLVGFGAQRFLMDVIAGTLIAFERWYDIGDFVRLEPAQISGIVEQLSLRTTVIRSLNGDRTYVPNSQIISASRSPAGYRRYSIEVLTTDPEEARNAIEQVGRRAPVGEARFLRPPRVIEERELGEGTWLVRGQADVAPTMEWLAESLLPGRLKASLSGDTLLADPIVYTIDEGTFSRYQRRVLVR